jgi:teichuronic acid biosynthesis glycosyltransferase TuaC
MRVLMVTGMYPSQGLSTNGIAVARQRKSLEAVGVQVDLLHCRPNGRREWFGSLSALRRRTSGGLYDIVHLHYGLTTTLLGYFQSLPVVITYHGTDINGYPLTTWREAHRSMAYSAAALFTRQLARRADAVIVMTPEMKQRLPAIVRAKTWVEPMGVDTSLFHPIPREAARGALGWGSEPVVVFCDANDESVKRRDLADAAVREAAKTCQAMRLFVVRDVDPEKVPLVLNAADCLLVTSDEEGSPNIVRESLACNLPIVSVPVGDVPELLAGDPESGQIVPRDPTLLGKALVDVFSRPRPANLPRLITNYSDKAIACRIVAIYRLILRNHDRSASNRAA